MHYHGVRHILKYLYCTKQDGIYFWRATPNENLPKIDPPTINSKLHDLLLDGRPLETDPFTLSASADSEWAACPQTRRSFAGACLRVAGGTVAYKSMLEPTVAMSSTEAEFMMAAYAGKMVLFVRSILWDLGVPQTSATILYEDNDAATAMANSQKPTNRTRHMDIKFHVLCEWVERDMITLERVATKYNMADHFTKQLTPVLFRRHTDYLLGHVPPAYSSHYKNLRGLCPPATQSPSLPNTPPVDSSPIAAAAAKLEANWALVLGYL